MTWKDIVKDERFSGAKKDREFKRIALKIMKDKYGEEEFRLASPRKHSKKMRDEYYHLMDLLRSGMSPEKADELPVVLEKTEIRKDDEEKRKYKIIAPLLEKIEEYMQDNDLDQVSSIKKAFDELEFHLMTDIGYTGEYENDDATPMEDAMYREKERQGNSY